MLNDPQPPDRKQHPLADRPTDRKRHPLEEGPLPSPPPRQEPREPQLTLRMPVVPPNFTYLLIAVNVIIFGLGMVSPVLQNEFFQMGASRAYEVLVLGEYQRLFTAMFLHANPPHIFFNMYALYIIGRGIEPIFGHARFLVIYLVGGLTGSVLSVVLGNPSPVLGVPSVGASGAVFALFAAEMIYLYHHRKIMGHRAVRQMRSLLVLLVINLGIGLASWMGSGGIRIDNWAHIGGMAGGAILTWFIGPRFVAQPDPERPGRLMAQDTNPFPPKYGVVSLYCIALVGILAVFSTLAR